MGLFMCAVAEHYRRNMVKLAALYKNEHLLHNALLQSEKLAVLGRMAATIAHEINNPLAAAMNSVFLAETSAERPESVREYLTLADQELRLISHITRQVLGFYRESTKPSSVSIGAIMDESLDIFQSKIKAKQATVEKQYGLGPQITAVLGELRQVFSNILANSLDAIEEHGTIKVRISSSQRGVAHGGTVRITVADNGKGIEAAVKPRIFEPMFTTKGDVGTGLGLWVSRQIVAKHKGSIRVHSSTKDENRGTVFSIVLPFSSNGLEVNLTLGSFDSAGPARHRTQKTMKANSNGEASVRGG
jgi:signal transduction histidine kinase